MPHFEGTYNSVVTGPSPSLSGTLTIPPDDRDDGQYALASDPSTQHAVTLSKNRQNLSFILTLNGVAYSFSGNFSQGNGKKKYSGCVTWPGNLLGTDGTWTAST